VIAVALPEGAEVAPEFRVTGGRETVVAGPVTAEIAVERKEKKSVLVSTTLLWRRYLRTATPRSAQRV